jgi:hypothetical protein
MFENKAVSLALCQRHCNVIEMAPIKSQAHRAAPCLCGYEVGAVGERTVLDGNSAQRKTFGFARIHGYAQLRSLQPTIAGLLIPRHRDAVSAWQARL